MKNSMEKIENIIGRDDAKDLRKDFQELLESDHFSYGAVEDLMLDFGLEMDYVEQLFF